MHTSHSRLTGNSTRAVASAGSQRTRRCLRFATLPRLGFDCFQGTPPSCRVHRSGWGWTDQVEEGPEAGPLRAAADAVGAVLAAMKSRLEDADSCTQYVAKAAQCGASASEQHDAARNEGCFPEAAMEIVAEGVRQALEQVSAYAVLMVGSNHATICRL